MGSDPPALRSNHTRNTIATGRPAVDSGETVWRARRHTGAGVAASGVGLRISDNRAIERKRMGPRDLLRWSSAAPPGDLATAPLKKERVKMALVLRSIPVPLGFRRLRSSVTCGHETASCRPNQ